jgi:hypothetical protein
MPDWELSDDDRMTLELLAETMIPADETNEGLKDRGFSGIIEMRNKYQPSLAKLYATGIASVNEISKELFEKPFVNLGEGERSQVVGSLLADDPPGARWTAQESPRAFFDNIKMDACFIYGTSEDVWEQIGFSGPSFSTGGHPDYDRPQE